MLTALLAGALAGALYVGSRCDALLVPDWSTRQAEPVTLELRDRGGGIELSLEDDRIVDSTGDRERTLTPVGWLVSSMQTNDVDRDGVDELVVLFWRRGSYGSSHPFWVTGADDRLCQHVAVLEWDGDALVQRWTSSALGAQVTEASFEPEGALVLQTTTGRTTRWTWDGWGFELME